MVVEELSNSLSNVTAKKSRSTSKPLKWSLLSRLSLVCKTWARELRPSLFKHLTLHTFSDAQLLTEMLQSPLSRWLATSIHFVTLDEARVQTPFNPMALKLGTLFSLLPAVQTMTCSRPSSPHIPAAFFSTVSRRSLRSLSASLSRLVLENQRFPDFITLAALLATLPSLHSVSLRRVTWAQLRDTGTPSLGRRGICGFSQLANFSVESCTQHWPPVLCFITPSTISLHQSHQYNEMLSALSDRILVENVARTAVSSRAERCDGLVTTYQRRWTNGDNDSKCIL